MQIPVNFRPYVTIILTSLLFLILTGCSGETSVAENQAPLPASTQKQHAPVAAVKSIDRKTAMMEEATCETCHGTLEQVAANTTPLYPAGVDTDAEIKALVTQVFPVNPHKSHYGDMPCTQCHKDGETTLYCNTCHDFQVQAQSAMVEISDKSCLKCHESYENMAGEIPQRFPRNARTKVQRAALVTQVFPVNAHKSHYGDMRCTQCHSIHGKSRFYCNTCHDFPEIDVP